MQLGRSCRAYAQKPQSCFLGSQTQALHFKAHQIFFLVPPEFKSVVLSCKPIHQVSLYQLRFFFTTECLFNTIVSLLKLSSGPHSSLFYTRYAGKTSLATMIVLFFLMGMVTEETHQIPVQSRPNIVTKKLNSPVQFCPFPVYPG